MLLALSWLPLIFFGAPKPSRPIHPQGWAFIEKVSALHFPSESARLHQFRTSGLPWWLSKTPGMHPIEFCGQPMPLITGLAKVWHPAPASAELLQTWQFKQKTALFPRQPCLA